MSAQNIKEVLDWPKYECHKIVTALQIGNQINLLPDGSAEVTFVNKIYGSIILPANIIARYIPFSGDYVVKYEDGYISVSPKAAFEEGYTRILL